MNWYQDMFYALSPLRYWCGLIAEKQVTTYIDEENEVVRITMTLNKYNKMMDAIKMSEKRIMMAQKKPIN